MSEQSRLKKLQTLEAEAKNILDVVKEQQRDASRKVNQASERLKEVRNEIRQLTVENPAVLVSEHAILRYFERVLGYDLEKIKSVIVPPQTQQQIEHFGGGTFPVSSNNNLPPFKIRVRNNTVVTVLTEDDSY